MHRILIVSPDPETSRMLALAFDLAGWEVQETTDVARSTSFTRNRALTLMDMAAFSHEPRARSVRTSVVGPLMILAPHGMTPEVAAKRFAKADLVITRPFELLSLLHRAERLLQQQERTLVRKPTSRPKRTTARKQRSRTRSPKVARKRSR